MKRGQISNLLRQTGLLFYTDRLRFYLEKFSNRDANQNFRKNYPEVKLPPDYLIYESFRMNYSKYYTDGKETAQWLAGYFAKYLQLKNLKILDWGCGPARIIRHLPSVIGNGCTYFGTDYNPKSIDWCSQNLPGIAFNLNSLEAKLPYPNEFFDVIYGISIFTHLSEKMHYDWFGELSRILKPGGIMFLTTQGNNFTGKLTPSEFENFEAGQLIVRGKVKEGHRTFSAFQPKVFMQNLFQGYKIEEHIEPPLETGKGIPQDIWIIRK
jgi:SAM-dependent methyltransferase